MAERVERALLGLLAEREEAFSQSLHDEVSPTLAAMRMALEPLLAVSASPPSLRVIGSALSFLDRWLEHQRLSMLSSLLMRMSAAEALGWYAARLEAARGTIVKVDLDGVKQEPPRLMALGLLGCLQEQLETLVSGPDNHSHIRFVADAASCSIRARVERVEPGGLRTTKARRTFEPVLAAIHGQARVTHRDGEAVVEIEVPVEVRGPAREPDS